MTTPLTETEPDHLLSFIGYGRLDADVWFLGMEEAGGGKANIRTRLKFRWDAPNTCTAHDERVCTSRPWFGFRAGAVAK